MSNKLDSLISMAILFGGILFVFFFGLPICIVKSAHGTFQRILGKLTACKQAGYFADQLLNITSGAGTAFLLCG